MPIPNFISTLPGMEAMATAMMKSMFNRHGVATSGQLLALAQERGVKLMACQMTMDGMGVKQSDVIDGVEFGGGMVGCSCRFTDQLFHRIAANKT